MLGIFYFTLKVSLFQVYALRDLVPFQQFKNVKNTQEEVSLLVKL